MQIAFISELLCFFLNHCRISTEVEFRFRRELGTQSDSTVQITRNRFTREKNAYLRILVCCQGVFIKKLILGRHREIYCL